MLSNWYRETDGQTDRRTEGRGLHSRHTFAGCSSPQTGHTTLRSTLYRQLENQAPNTTGINHLYNTLELLMMGIMVPETCWASNKICNKNSSVPSSWHFISTYYRRCTVKATSNNRTVKNHPKGISQWKSYSRRSLGKFLGVRSGANKFSVLLGYSAASMKY
jgi:hypothetical protein